MRGWRKIGERIKDWREWDIEERISDLRENKTWKRGWWKNEELEKEWEIKERLEKE